ncbi:MAG: hypothetical protein ACFCBW_22960, partial [Candidatus Competibacterales bacterium]
RTLEEAILGVVSSIDRPGSPAGEAIGAYFGIQYGRTPVWRRQYRQRILQVTLDDLKDVAKRYLTPDKASTAVIANGERLANTGLEIHKV